MFPYTLPFDIHLFLVLRCVQDHLAVITHAIELRITEFGLKVIQIAIVVSTDVRKLMLRFGKG